MSELITLFQKTEKNTYLNFAKKKKVYLFFPHQQLSVAQKTM